MQPADAPPWLKSAGLIQLALLLGLAMLSGVSEVRLTPADGWGWWLLCAVMMLGLLCTILAINRKVRTSRPWRLVFAAIALSPLAAVAIFGGLRIILHHASSHDGAMTLTIAATQDTYRKSTCRPRARIAEFSFLTNHLCLSQEQFRGLVPGQQLTVLGNVSPFGVTPVRLILSRSSIEHPAVRDEENKELLVVAALAGLVSILIGWGYFHWAARRR